ncbi:MAG: hypothetical protein HYZ26_00935 [Chloroflexi bacterium]|nr:hypothetical protein [Chloroflexota bacterium]
MKKYLFLFHDQWDPTQENKDAWSKWFAAVGDKMVDSGSPLGPGREVTPAGGKDLSPEMGAATGYSIFSAENLSEAEKLLEGCPIASSVRVYEALSM